MKSGIFAVVSIAGLKLYVGEVHHLHTRWRYMMVLFNNGKFPHPQLQAAWNLKGDQRQFTFHKADEIADNREILGKKLFFADIETPNEI